MSSQYSETCEICGMVKEKHPKSASELKNLSLIKQLLTEPSIDVDTNAKDRRKGKRTAYPTDHIIDAFKSKLSLNNARTSEEILEDDDCPLCFAVKLGKLDLALFLLESLRLQNEKDRFDRYDDPKNYFDLRAISGADYFERMELIDRLRCLGICELPAIRCLNFLATRTVILCPNSRKSENLTVLFHAVARRIHNTELIDRDFSEMLGLFLARGTCMECFYGPRKKWELQPVLDMLKNDSETIAKLKDGSILINKFLNEHGLQPDKPLIERILHYPLHYMAQRDIPFVAAGIDIPESMLEYALKHTNCDIEEDNFSSGSVLFEAVSHNMLNNVETLLQRGANIESVSQYHQKTPLMYAVEKNYLDCVELLLEYGADVYHQVREETSVSIAIENNHSECLELLLSRVTGDLKIDRFQLLCITRQITPETMRVVARYGALQEIEDRLADIPWHNRLYSRVITNCGTKGTARNILDYLEECKAELRLLQTCSAHGLTMYYEILMHGVPDDFPRDPSVPANIAKSFPIYSKRINYILAQAKFNADVKMAVARWLYVSPSATTEQKLKYEKNLKRTWRKNLRDSNKI